MTEFYNPEVQQAFLDTCATKSQQLILNDFGIEVSEVDLVQTKRGKLSLVNAIVGTELCPADIGIILQKIRNFDCFIAVLFIFLYPYFSCKEKD